MTAERLFAERGVDTVSLREIGLAAGQRNKVATQYHFGDRETLILAIFSRRSGHMNRRRLDLLSEADASGLGLDVPTLLWALIQPLSEHLAEPGNYYIGFLSRLHAERGIFRKDQGRQLPDSEGRDRIMERLHSAVDLPAELFDRRYRQVFAWAIDSLAGYQSSTPPSPDVLRHAVDDLVQMLAAAMTASSEARPLTVSRGSTDVGSTSRSVDQGQRPSPPKTVRGRPRTTSTSQPNRRIR